MTAILSQAVTDIMPSSSVEGAGPVRGPRNGSRQGKCRSIRRFRCTQTALVPLRDHTKSVHRKPHKLRSRVDSTARELGATIKEETAVNGWGCYRSNKRSDVDCIFFVCKNVMEQCRGSSSIIPNMKSFEIPTTRKYTWR